MPGSVSRTYDSDFRVQTQSVNGANTVAMTYDADSLLTGAGGLSLARDPQRGGLLTGTTLGVVTDAWTYNSHAEPTDYTARVSGADVYSVQYTRDGIGRIQRKVETILGLQDTYDYTYDLAGRLTAVVKNGVTNIIYTHDTNGNRLSYTGPLGSVSSVIYDAQDRMTSGGNTYTYDELGNLTKVVLPGGTTIDYVIDGQNRRIGKKVNGTLTTRWL